MVEALYFKFVATWVLGVLALIAGRYAPPGGVEFPAAWSLRISVFLAAWCVAFITALAFGALGYAMKWPEAAQAGFANFLLPIIAGGLVCRVMLNKRSAPPA